MEHNHPYSLIGKGKPLVFQHGLGASKLQIETLLDALQDVRMLTMDMPGHGDHPLDPAIIPSFNTFADEAIRIMDLNGIYRTVAGGLSMGSGIALNLTCRYPERVAGLILLRPAWHLTPNPDNLRILLDVADHLENRQRNAFIRKPELKEIRRQAGGAAESILGLFERSQPDHVALLLRAMVADKPLPPEDPPLITLPALVIGNDDDPLHPWEMALAWHDMLPNSRLLKVPSRYLDPDGHKREVNDAVQEFMNYITIN